MNSRGKERGSEGYLIDSWSDMSNLEKLLEIFNSEVANSDAPEEIGQRKPTGHRQDAGHREKPSTVPSQLLLLGLFKLPPGTLQVVVNDCR